MTTCPHCDNSSWTLSEVNASGAAWKYYAIQCSRCNAPATMVEYNNIGATIADLDDKIDKMANDLASKIATLNHNIGIVANLVNKR